MAKFLVDVDDDDVGASTIYHIFDNTWLYGKITARKIEHVCQYCGKKPRNFDDVVFDDNSKVAHKDCWKANN